MVEAQATNGERAARSSWPATNSMSMGVLSALKYWMRSYGPQWSPNVGVVSPGYSARTFTKVSRMNLGNDLASCVVASYCGFSLGIQVAAWSLAWRHLPICLLASLGILLQGIIRFGAGGEVPSG